MVSGTDRRDFDGHHQRRDLASRLLGGYVHGPAAATEATARALAKVAAARAVVLVEGISDQIAVETLAARRGRDLGAESVVVLPAGGAHAMARYLARFGPAGAGLRLAGLCDAGEESVVRRGLASAGVGSPGTRADMERLGFFVCVEDLEDELIRAIGAARAEALIDSQGDLGSFRSLQRQLEWRGQPAGAQLRRFLGSGARRKLRYARLLAGSVALDRLPRPLEAVLTRA
jgi:OLD-like protein